MVKGVVRKTKPRADGLPVMDLRSSIFAKSYYWTVKTTAGLTMLPEVAVIFVVWPLVPTTVATPKESMVATAAVEEVHVTEVVMSAVVPSELCPVAVYCWVRPLAIMAVVGVTLIVCSTTAFPTATVTDAVIPFDAVAWMVVEPLLTPVTTPLPVTVATAVLFETQVTEDETSLVLLLSKVPRADKVVVPPTATVGDAGEIAIDVSWGSVKKSLQPAPIKMNPTNASSTGQALRVGKEIITKPQEGRPYEQPRRISEILAEIGAWLPYPNGPSGAVFATRKQTRPEPPPELDFREIAKVRGTCEFCGQSSPVDSREPIHPRSSAPN
jgi:hypothetical protein